MSDEPTPYFPDFAGALALLFSAGFPGIALLTQVLPVPLDLYTLFEEATVGSGLAGFALGLRLTGQGVALTYRMVPALAPTAS